MINWLLNLTDEQRRIALNQAAIVSGMQVKAIEKDWWVTLTLKALFQTEYKDYLVFKGGTSLSKCWNLIERFSEDIDIGISPEALGMEYRDEPSKSYVEKLRKKGCEFTSTTFKDALEASFIQLGIPAGTITITAKEVKAEHTDVDPQTLYISYTSLFDPNPYLADVVKIEASTRSLKEPFENREVRSILTTYFPNVAYEEIPFVVAATAPQRTFLEKCFLLHEEFNTKEDDKIRFERMSRHLYDLDRMMDLEPGMIALNGNDLFNTILHHRINYTPIRGYDYSNLTPATIKFIPPPAVLESYRDDYAVMVEQMIYGETRNFDEIIKRLEELENRYRAIGTKG
jgi:hypothetical protein